MAQQILLDESSIADIIGSRSEDGTTEVAPDLSYRRLALVNVAFYGAPDAGDRHWVLIDAGLFGATRFLVSSAEERFGAGTRPAAIILTHGHFDHVGGLPELAEKWEVPVYAHPLELPFLNGQRSYPPPDTSVGGGVMPWLAPLFPRGPINLGQWLKPLPADGSIPGMPGWRWLHTPGHAPGHVSLWRESDRTIVVGDAFVTTAQESAYAVATQAPEMHGPPRYFTPDWSSAHESVRQLAALEPEVVVTGHGRAMRGADMRRALHTLADQFVQVAMPEKLRPGAV